MIYDKLRKDATHLNIDPTFHESYTQSDRSFPIRVHHIHYEGHRKQLIDRHWHEEMEILFVVQGIMEISIEGNSFFANGGDIILIPSKLTHDAINPGSAECEFYAIVFHWEILFSFKDDLIQQLYISPMLDHSKEYVYVIKEGMKEQTDFSSLLWQIITHYGKGEEGYELAIKAYLFLFFQALQKNKGKIENLKVKLSHHKGDAQSDLCKKVMTYVEQNYYRKLTLNEISQKMGLERSYFCRFFKKNFNMSFFTYLTLFRIRHGEYLLLHTNKKIIDIAIECGFEDAAYFSSAFKKINEQTPREYRKSKKNIHSA